MVFLIQAVVLIFAILCLIGISIFCSWLIKEKIPGPKWLHYVIPIIAFVGTLVGLYHAYISPPSIYLASGEETADGIPSPATISLNANPFLSIYYTINGTDPHNGILYDPDRKIILTEPRRILACTKFLCFWSPIDSSRYFQVYDSKESSGYVPLKAVRPTESGQYYLSPDGVDRVKLEVTLQPANASGKGFTWSSDNVTVATVAGSGTSAVVTGHSPGMAAITAESFEGPNMMAIFLVYVGEAIPQSSPIAPPSVVPAPVSPGASKSPTVTPKASRPASAHNTPKPTHTPAIRSASPIPSNTAMPSSIATAAPSAAIIITHTPVSPSPTPPPAPPPTLEAISIHSLPKVQEYELWDYVDTTGLAITEHYSDGSTTVVRSGFNCSPERFTSAGRTRVLVTYGGLETSYYVSVAELIEDTPQPIIRPTAEPTPAPPVLESIYIHSSPDQDLYTVGDTLDTAGLIVMGLYSDNSREEISGFSCSPNTLNEAGAQTISVSYHGFSTTFDVDVQYPIEILTSKAYQSDSHITIEFETNVPFSKATISTGGQTYTVPNAGISTGTMALDRKYFTNNSYSFVLVVQDKDGHEDQCTINIALEEISVSLSSNSLEVPLGETRSITARVTGLSGHSVRWSTDDSSIADVESTGVLREDYDIGNISAHSLGTTTITVTVGGKSDTCIVTVID